MAADRVDHKASPEGVHRNHIWYGSMAGTGEQALGTHQFHLQLVLFIVKITFVRILLTIAVNDIIRPDCHLAYIMAGHIQLAQ